MVDIQQIKTVGEFREGIVRPTLLQYTSEKTAGIILMTTDLYYVKGVTEHNLHGYLLSLYDVCGDCIGPQSMAIVKELEKQYAIFTGTKLGVDPQRDPYHTEIDNIIKRLEDLIK